MKADIYFCVVADLSVKDGLYRALESSDFKQIHDNNGDNVSFLSDTYVVEYADLGEALLENCRSKNIPNVSNIGSVLAYMQVLIDYNIMVDFKLFLSKELLNLLGDKGFGIDIHHK